MYELNRYTNTNTNRNTNTNTNILLQKVTQKNTNMSATQFEIWDNEEADGGKQLYPFPTELKESPGKGRGLFATKDISKGTIVALYPMDIVYSMTETNDGYGTLDRIGIQSTRPIQAFIADENIDMSVEDFMKLPKEHEIHPRFMKYLKMRATTDTEGYSQGMGCRCVPYSTILGLKEFADEMFNAHLINDCISEKTKEILATKTIKNNAQYRKLQQKYEKDFVKNCNVMGMSMNCYYVMVSSKDIKAGEELLYVYGADYWRKYYGLKKNEKEVWSEKRIAERKKYGYLSKFNPTYRAKYPVDTMREVKNIHKDLRVISVVFRDIDKKLNIEPAELNLGRGIPLINWEEVDEAFLDINVNK